MIDKRTDNGVVTITIRPNSSLSWRGNLQFLASMSAVSMSIAAWFAWQGTWLILPFAGAELTVLAAALYLVSSRSMHREVVLIDADTVKICKGCREVELIARLQRYWARVRLEVPEKTWYPSRLVIQSHGQQTEVGSFLDEGERGVLAERLKRAI